jgi:hypothetical protein
MRLFTWQVILGLVLVVLSAFVYVLHYVAFRDVHHILIYLVGDIAFVFIEVLLVTMIIHDLLSRRERRVRLEKLNMVIGAFFSNVGTELLAYISDHDPELEKLKDHLVMTSTWSDREFSKVGTQLKTYAHQLDIQSMDLVHLREFLAKRSDFLLRLLENPVLLEHESFTNLLRAVFHFAEELGRRGTFEGLPESDYQHLAGDARRVYRTLVSEWVDYMEYLKQNYPYLFSLAVRTNPFDENASPVVKG